MLFEKGDFISTFDLKSGYHHVDINEQSQVFGFCMAAGILCVYSVTLWFVLSMLCFTKLLRPLVKLWHGKGIRSVVIIDDGIIIANSQWRCKGVTRGSWFCS